MPHWLEIVFALALFLAGLRLSFFFSGSETGFYRLSVPRLSIDARAGDRPSGMLLWFAQHPAYFVSTCLIGNNVANYLCTAAVSWGTVLLAGRNHETLEVGAALLMAPVIFEIGELLPKSLYYLTPLSRLRREIGWFRGWFRLFLPLGWPLVQLSRLIERSTGIRSQPMEMVLGRSRLVQLVHHGQREGVLTDLQSRLANGLLQLAPQTVLSSMIPASRVLGIPDTASREEMIDFARRFGVAAVAVRHPHDESGWYGYVFAAELLAISGDQPMIHSMPRISHQTSKLEALHLLQVADAAYGVVVRQGTVLGIVARNGLVEQIYRPATVSISAPRQ